MRVAIPRYLSCVELTYFRRASGGFQMLLISNYLISLPASICKVQLQCSGFPVKQDIITFGKKGIMLHHQVSSYIYIFYFLRLVSSAYAIRLTLEAS